VEDIMRQRLFTVVILLICGLAVSAGTPRPIPRAIDPDGLVVHEWGTFTSVVADADGTPEEWVPQIGPAELPCFVERARFNIKGWLPATVRMETPVLYFYSGVNRTVDVGVRFRRGAVTEWYPKAEVTPKAIESQTLTNRSLEGRITWASVEVRPRDEETYPIAGQSNHYYAARKTEASPVVVGGQREKFLFYRGVGSFALPVSARLTDEGRVVVTPSPGQSIGDVMLFENRGGVVRYATAQPGSRESTLQVPSAAASRESVQAELESVLVAHGLYRKEAAAMIETWRDSWFEDGLRLFYIVPRAAIDDVLPLHVTPAPASVARVFVGRIELITPAIVDEVRAALRARDRAPLTKYGRFLRPIMTRLASVSTTLPSAEWNAQMQFAYSTVSPSPAGCR
jgi:hypothetical protein